MGLFKTKKKLTLLGTTKSVKRSKYIIVSALFCLTIAGIAYLLCTNDVDLAPTAKPEEHIQYSKKYNQEQKESLIFVQYAFGKFQTEIRPAYDDLLAYGSNYIGINSKQLNNYTKLISNYQENLLKYENLYPEQVTALNMVSSNILIFAKSLYSEKNWTKHLDLINSINNDISKLNSPLISLLHSKQLEYQIVRQNDLNIIKF